MAENRKTTRYTVYGLVFALGLFIILYGLLPLWGTAAAS